LIARIPEFLVIFSVSWQGFKWGKRHKWKKLHAKWKIRDSDSVMVWDSCSSSKKITPGTCFTT